jgi:hypothetical protein
MFNFFKKIFRRSEVTPDGPSFVGMRRSIPGNSNAFEFSPGMNCNEWVVVQKADIIREDFRQTFPCPSGQGTGMVQYEVYRIWLRNTPEWGR